MPLESGDPFLLILLAISQLMISFQLTADCPLVLYF